MGTKTLQEVDRGATGNSSGSVHCFENSQLHKREFSIASLKEGQMKKRNRWERFCQVDGLLVAGVS